VQKAIARRGQGVRIGPSSPIASPCPSRLSSSFKAGRALPCLQQQGGAQAAATTCGHQGFESVSAAAARRSTSAR